MLMEIGAVVWKGDVYQHAPFFSVTAGLVGYYLLVVETAARSFSLLCPVETQNSDHSGQLLLYHLI